MYKKGVVCRNSKFKSGIGETLNFSMHGDRGNNTNNIEKFVICNLSFVMCPMSFTMCHMSCVMSHVSCVTRHPSPVIYHLSPVKTKEV